ncbi:hypothetical protein ZIOFF_046149 [Zingiber officinale]|uniref:NADH:ubiquinone reductase (non-electrogenic) n=1 Tax=Zingiber officinale TaxID=94328 RepID=A0A8J5KZ08_ZINOF|nr:hypothetical protein ZIOFF_046149 [Zingiber officinale]
MYSLPYSQFCNCVKLPTVLHRQAQAQAPSPCDLHLIQAALSQSRSRTAAGGMHYRPETLFRAGVPSGQPYHTLLNGARHLSPIRRAGVFGDESRAISHTPHSQSPSASAAAAARKDELADEDDERLPGLEATKPGQKPRVVVLGTGWAGCRFLKGLDAKLYDIVCISPRNHMVFTPLLASTCVGTLEFRSVAEPVSRIQSALARSPDSYFYLASCTGIDTDKHEATSSTTPLHHIRRQLPRLVLTVSAVCRCTVSPFPATGSRLIPPTASELHTTSWSSQPFRSSLCFRVECAGISEDEKKRLLHCVVVGGGPTGVEFSGELSDFIMKDVRERYSHVKDYIRVTLIESGVRLVRGVVKEVLPEVIHLNDGTSVPYGLLVWSTGVGPSQFIKSLNFPQSPGGRIGVDQWLRVPSAEDVFALGDCAGFLEQTGKPVLPALAQVAEREGKYLANLFNQIGKTNAGKAYCAKEVPLGDPFVYKHLGSMASVGRYKALVDLRQNKDAKGLSMAGFVSWFIWRSAYLTRVVSWRNRFYVAVNWATTLVFGRDNSRIG